MKKLLSILLVLAIGLSLVACSESTTMSMGTGSPSGTYFNYGSVLSKHISDKTDLSVNPISTGGSKANIKGIDVGNFSLATVQSDVMDYAWNGTGIFKEDGKIDSFRTVAGLYAEAVQLVTTNDSIKSIEDLKGKTVSIGANGSGVYLNAIDTLTAAGLSVGDINPVYQNFDKSANSLKDGKIDAAFIVAGAPTPAIADLCAKNNKVRIVPIDGEIAQRLMETNSFYSVYKIPANTYDNQGTEILTVTVKATLIVSADASEDDVYALTAAIFDNIKDIKHAKAAELSLENATEGISVPFHKGAAKYFKEKSIEVESK